MNWFGDLYFNWVGLGLAVGEETIAGGEFEVSCSFHTPKVDAGLAWDMPT